MPITLDALTVNFPLEHERKASAGARHRRDVQAITRRFADRIDVLVP